MVCAATTSRLFDPFHRAQDTTAYVLASVGVWSGIQNSLFIDIPSTHVGVNGAVDCSKSADVDRSAAEDIVTRDL